MIQNNTENQSSTESKDDVTGDDIFSLIGKSESIDSASKALQAMGHPMRLKILCILSSGEISVLEIVEALGTSQSNISQHLAVLKEQKIVSARRDGVQMFYSIQDARIFKMISLTRNIFCDVEVGSEDDKLKMLESIPRKTP